MPTPDLSVYTRALDAKLAAGLKNRLSTPPSDTSGELPPVDHRIQAFLDRYLIAAGGAPQLPADTLVLDRPGMARLLSLPPDRDEHASEILTSYRVRQGVLHNPRADRRTTQGTFHVAVGGLPIPDDKIAVPAAIFGTLLRHALAPPASLLQLPYTATTAQPAGRLVSLLLRPIVCPAVPGWCEQRSLEIRFFAPGSLVANLDFVERIFGNAGDPALAANDAGLDPALWTGHTGCVILAPHLTNLTKRDLGLPAWADATPRQQRDGMCWRDPAERYNTGGAFKLTARDASGVIVTLIADNYFGYCKKEVKTQISFAANLLGHAEEEHAGGAIAFPSYDLGESFQLSTYVPVVGHTIARALELLGDRVELQPGGWARDRQFPDIHFVPQDSQFSLRGQRISWHDAAGAEQSLKLLPGITYVLPSGYKVAMVKPTDGRRRWRLSGTTAEGLLCHKPCTVSGGGKSEISKSIADATITGPVFVNDVTRDLDAVDAILRRDYMSRFLDPAHRPEHGRPLLGAERSLGSVVKLLSPSPDFTPEYNAWLASIPRYIRDIVLLIKRIYQADWGDHWREHFSVDTINGRPGNELKFEGQKLLTHYLRVGFTPAGNWRIFGLRKDFLPACKIQAEDDITASAVVPAAALAGLPRHITGRAAKFVQNCEQHLFQRPDEAVHRGYDRRTERDFTQPGNFLSNYEPLDRAAATAIVEDTLGFENFTEPVQHLFTTFLAEDRPAYLVSSAHPRLVNGKPSRNPRYLQYRPDLEDPRSTYLAYLGAQLYRELPNGTPSLFPVGAVLMGRRQNAPDQGVRPLCAYGPVHYQELPEAFMDLIASLTGKSPSTTGAGSEGALTKGPFNALAPIHDLNAALVSFVVTGLPIFVSAAGCIGPHYRVDHDISLLVPELWCRMTPEERDPVFLIRQGHLERCTDFTHAGRNVPASRLGWRITERFVQTFCGRVLGDPGSLFEPDMLRPELQDPAVYADSVANIASAMRHAAELYFTDGSIACAVPPLRALLHLMRDGNWEGHALGDPVFRALFDREEILASDWYLARLHAQQTKDIALWEKHTRYLASFLERRADIDMPLAERAAAARATLATVRDPAYARSLLGTIGVDPALAGATGNMSDGIASGG